MTAAGASCVVLGFAPMDDVHSEFFGVVERALQAPDAEFETCLQAAVDHLRAHFDAEDRWMKETAFPAADCHMQEHAAVLKSAAEVLALPRSDRIDVGRSFVRELQRWFPGHADYLDSALAAWMCKQAHGGKPVVLQRKRDAR